ncbi:DUF2283 domain-containing protein [Acidipropionibacterium timonense]|uniref:DUF2283 domain-containing protein n=1 Tax=Acidipropionibacterium timonense TaxID=2161818 RepID=UPI00102F8023|nr:DUF2283 domain-containing protein [Acidipropionibacterium timonense]
MIVRTTSTYSRLIDAVYLYPGDLRDTDAQYACTLVVDVEGLTQSINIDVDDRGRILGFEILCASMVFSPDILRSLEQMD